MEVEPIVIYPPNRPLERDFTPSKTPVMYQYLFFIDINNKGQFIVGCSNISGSYWEGTLFFYKDATSLLEQTYSNYFISESSTADGKFITSDRVILAEDNGGLRLLRLPETYESVGIPFKCEGVFESTNRIEKISVWHNTYKAVTCSENSLHLWMFSDEATSYPLQEYKNYHTEAVTAIDTKRNEEGIFVSTAADKKAVIWDLRQSIRPAMVLYSNEFSILTAAAWNLTRQEYVVVGNEAGDVYLLDTRLPKEFVCVSHSFASRIHDLKFNCNSYIGVCADTPEFLILNCDNVNLSPIYRNRVHKGFIRGLAWQGNTLYTCAFDGKVLKHNIPDTF